MHDPHEVALACIFLASKIEEDVQKVERILQVAKDDVASSLSEKADDQIFLYERVILNTLSFDIGVDHPRDHVRAFVKMLTAHSRKEEMELLQMACILINDSLSSPLCLKYPAEQMAAAGVTLAVKMLQARSGVPTPRYVEILANFERRGEVFKCSLQDLRAIEQDIIKFYEQILE